MSAECVVIVRLNTGDDVIAIIAGEIDGKVRVEYPYYIRYNTGVGSVGMLPYCALSDEIYFEIDRSKIDFVVTANTDITSKFLRMVDDIEQKTLSDSLTSDEPYERYEAAMHNNTFIPGNDTKH